MQLLQGLTASPAAQLAVLEAAVENAAGELPTACHPMMYSSSIQKLLQLCQGNEQLMQQLSVALASALQHKPGAWQIDGCMDILQALQAAPAAHLEVASAAVAPAAATLSDGAASPELHFGHVVPLLQACGGQQQLKIAVIEAVCCGVRTSADAWKSKCFTQLLQALQQTPEARLAVIAAAVEGVAAVVRTSTASLMQHSSNTIKGLQLCQGQPQLTDQLTEAMCCAIRSSTDAWQLSGLQQLLQALEATPAARLAVLTAAVAPLFESKSNNNADEGLSCGMLLSKQTTDSLLQLSQLLLSEPQLYAASYGQLAAEAAARKYNYSLLKQLLQSAAVQAALDRPEVQQLVACQVANLQRMAAVPAFSWHMPQAKMPGFPQVEAFLQGPEESFALRGFLGITEARTAAKQLILCNAPRFHSGYSSYSSYSSSYSFTALAKGAGDDAHVAIRKTQEYYIEQLKRLPAVIQELQGVLALVRPAAGAAVAEA